MTEENAEIVRRALAAFDSGLDAAAEFWDPEIDWRAIEGAPDDIGVFTGHDAMRRYYEQWYETFEAIQLETEELIDAGDQVVVMLHVTAQMKGSDASVDMRVGIVYGLKDGLIVRGREYATRGEALKAAGLPEN
jgi:ketosteroid isomerase-like protein